MTRPTSPLPAYRFAVKATNGHVFSDHKTLEAARRSAKKAPGSYIFDKWLKTEEPSQ